jgi:hypothetical protein
MIHDLHGWSSVQQERIFMGFSGTACSDFNCFGSSYATISIGTLTVK